MLEGARRGSAGVSARCSAILAILDPVPNQETLCRRKDVLWRELPGTLIVGRVDGGILRATGSAEAVWRHLEVPCTMEALVASLAAEFSIAAETIRPSVAEFVADLIREEMVVVE